jgi:exodeoxyribonuclease VIII
MEVQVSNRQQHIDRIVHKLMGHDDHLSYSSISAFKNSPRTFIDYKLGVKEDTEAMQYGSMLHCLVLEPEDFFNRYHIIEDLEICNQIGGAKPRSTKAYKEWYQAALQEAGEKQIVETADYVSAKIAAENIHSNRASAKILQMASEYEKPIEWEFKNFRFKGFIDGHGEKIIFDLKTCTDASPQKFQGEIMQRGYYMQAAMYLCGLGQVKDSYIIAADRKNGVSVHKIETKLVEHGATEFNEILDKFNHCILTDSFDQSHDFWSDRWDGIFMCEKPGYLY